MGPIPIALLDALLQVAILGVAGTTWLGANIELLLGILSMAAAGAAVWFIALQLVILRQVCPYCMAIQALGLFEGLITWWSGSVSAGAAGIGLTLAAMLAVGQLLLRPRMFVEFQPPETNNATDQIGALVPTCEADQNAMIADEVVLVNGQVRLRRSDWPVMGKPKARQAIAVLYDVTCPDCRHLHRLLSQVLGAGNLDIAVLMIPTPLHSSCNRGVIHDRPEHVNSCAYARLTLALWKLDPKACMEHEQWMLNSIRVPPLADARRKAEQMVNSLRLATALMDASIEQRIQETTRVFGAAPKDVLPQMLLARTVVIGRVGTEGELREILEGTKL